MAEFQPAAPSDSTFDLLHGMDFNFNWLAYNLAGANNESSHLARDPATAEFLAYDPAVDFNLFAEFNTLIPSIAPPADPLQNFMDLYGTSSAFFDAGAPTDFGSFSAGSFDEPLPLLPPPPPESPPAVVPPVEQASEPGPSVPRSHRPRKEVDEATILHTTRSRAATARKRYGESDAVSNRPQKKRKLNGVIGPELALEL
ncbi:hypothetical protein DFH09DRAFT_1147511 [Mycena vulgaris]|nr:hypothetical protein DFH09DRAFT_1147511 [Mycena vulgaris]